MYRRLIAISAIAAAALAFGLPGAADAGPGDEPQPNLLTVVKEVEGPVPDGAVFEVEVVCEPTHAMMGVQEGMSISTTMTFDAAGNPIGDNSLEVGFGYDCTATETVTNGASVGYACAATNATNGNTNGNMSPAEDDPVFAQCLDDQTVRFQYLQLIPCDNPTAVCAGEAEGNGYLGEGTITVTNTFAPADVAPDDVAPDDVVAATPTFTG